MTTLTTIDVTGMTCGHCVSAVTTELEKVADVERVSVELHDGGTSHVTVFSDHELPGDALRAAVDEAGYDVVGISSHGAAEEFSKLAEVRAEEYGTGGATGAPDDEGEGATPRS
ncbi:copper chaperone [Serinibacter arcticus]|uniref:Copper chaperone n=1 Tax=Serinibacter arcticus TaxID=1655435 RepID=A0A2U1ZVH8_9MICO|nr:cation transporter [Serinibacter arcticus]PWD50971.1 copper chaperone [Serinibacter arcticus]